MRPCRVLARSACAVFASVRASCLGSTFELEGDLRRFGKPTTVFFSVVSVAGRDYAFENLRYDLPGGLIMCGDYVADRRGLAYASIIRALTRSDTYFTNSSSFFLSKFCEYTPLAIPTPPNTHTDTHPNV